MLKAQVVGSYVKGDLAHYLLTEQSRKPLRGSVRNGVNVPLTVEYVKFFL